MEDKDPKNKEPNNKNPILQALAVTTVIGAELAIMVTTGFYLGLYADSKLGTKPWIMIAGILVGIGLGIWGVVKTLNRFWKEGE